MGDSGEKFSSREFADDENRHDPLRPPHSRKFAQFSIEWYRACNQAFCRAMRDEFARGRPLRVSPEAQTHINQTLRMYGAT